MMMVLTTHLTILFLALENKELKPLVQTHWHQGTPFNDQALEIRGEHAAAGCVNIAFAQLIAFQRKTN